jgi:hypothetical protein
MGWCFGCGEYIEALRTKNYSERTLETRENYLVAFEGVRTGT